MSLASRIESLVIRVAQEFIEVRAKTGNLADLATADRSSLVAAINELKSAVATGTGIDDEAITTSTTYSSSKIVGLLDALKAEILGGADAAYDTLLEIQTLLSSGTSGLDALLAAVNHRLRFDTAQSLTVEEQAQVRANVGAVASADVGDTDTDFSAIFETALVDRIADLAIRIGRSLATKIDATHPGVAKAWVCFGVEREDVVIRAAHNVTRVTRSAPGRYRVYFSLRLPDADYCWTAFARSSMDRGQQRLALVRATADMKTARYVDVCCATAASTFTDSTEINLVVYR